MKKHPLGWGAGVGIICAMTSLLTFRDYVATRKPIMELDLLRGASAYVQQYNGESPKEALEYAQKTLAIAGKNKSFKPYAEMLEARVAEISSQIGESSTPDVYRPVLRNISAEIAGVVQDEEARLRRFLPIGVITGIGALSILGMNVHELEKKRIINAQILLQL